MIEEELEKRHRARKGESTKEAEVWYFQKRKGLWQLNEKKGGVGKNVGGLEGGRGATATDAEKTIFRQPGPA